ncbi:hypothetical protein AAF463_24280 (plasmid) [Pantoea sp. BJ2]|uniref:Uncharacterized protein n=1 Tax=Pantoea sp. BJ2 TaxID=3141322 RepID=A0AAU7U3A0_9GAMM
MALYKMNCSLEAKEALEQMRYLLSAWAKNNSPVAGAEAAVMAALREAHLTGFYGWLL